MQLKIRINPSENELLKANFLHGLSWAVTYLIGVGLTLLLTAVITGSLRI